MAIEDDYSEEEIRAVIAFKEQSELILRNRPLKDDKNKELKKLWNSRPLGYEDQKLSGKDLSAKFGSGDYYPTNIELIQCCQELFILHLDQLKALIKPSAGAALSSPAADNSQPMSALPESKPPQTLAVTVVGNDENATNHKNFIPSAIERYNQLSKLESGSSYKPGYVQPEVVEGGVQFKFPDAEKSLQFMQALADGKGSFFVLDKDKKVMAYSTGDGTLYKADGKPYEKGAKLESSNVTQADVEERLSAEKPSSSMRR